MTLIVSQVCHRYVLQVSDRLVSSVGDGRARPFDASSNKTVVLQARDGIASLSYSGLSYIGDQPTDSWIAELLLGHRMAEMEPGTPFTMLLGKREGPWHFMGPALRMIAEGLGDAARLDPGFLRQPVVVVVAGWQWYRANRRRPRPFFARIQPSSSGSYVLHYGQRLYGNQFTAMPVPTSYLGPQERLPFLDKLRSLDPDSGLNELVGTIRMVAARTDAVGGDCMSVLISHPFAPERKVTVRYISQDPYTTLGSRGQQARAGVTYGPWLVGKRIVVAPSLMVGSGPALYPLGPYTAAVEGPPPDAPRPFNLAMLHTSQRRPRRP